MNEKHEAGDYRLKLYELAGYWHLDFLFKGERFMGFIHKIYQVMKDDFETAKGILNG